MTDAKEENVFHDKEFYDQMRECRPSYRKLGELIHEALAMMPGTLLDIGCGTGAQTARLAELGWRATGVDVFETNPDPGFTFENRDLLKDPFLHEFDVVVCTETAEHLYENRADRLVEVVAMHAKKKVLWSAAQPGQEWEGHVNLQYPEYWLEKFRKRGLVLDMQATASLQTRMLETRAQHWAARTNFHVLYRE